MAFRQPVFGERNLIPNGYREWITSVGKFTSVTPVGVSCSLHSYGVLRVHIGRFTLVWGFPHSDGGGYPVCLGLLYLTEGLLSFQRF